MWLSNLSSRGDCRSAVDRTTLRYTDMRVDSELSDVQGVFDS